MPFPEGLGMALPRKALPSEIGKNPRVTRNGPTMPFPAGLGRILPCLPKGIGNGLAVPSQRHQEGSQWDQELSHPVLPHCPHPALPASSCCWRLPTLAVSSRWVPAPGHPGFVPGNATGMPPQHPDRAFAFPSTPAFPGLGKPPGAGI